MSGPDALRLAVVGVGWAGRRQIEALRELGGELAVECLVDSDAEHLAARADELGIDKTYAGLEQALADPQVEAVSICTPHGLHCEAAIAAARAGKHVLVEKPMATTVGDATRMLEAAAAYGVKLFVAENLPYGVMATLLRALLESDAIGELVSASVVAGFQARNFGYPGRRAWLTRPDLGGTGTWMLHGVHTIAQLRSVLGEVETVALREHHAASFERPDIEGTMSGLLTMASGIAVTLVQTSEVRLPGTLAGYVIHGDRGTVRASAAGCELFSDGADEPRHIPYPTDVLSDYAQELHAFAGLVRADRPGLTDGRSERRTLAVVQAGYESAASGQPVNLRDRFGAL